MKKVPSIKISSCLKRDNLQILFTQIFSLVFSDETDIKKIVIKYCKKNLEKGFFVIEEIPVSNPFIK